LVFRHGSHVARPWWLQNDYQLFSNLLTNSLISQKIDHNYT
jgi:hypothetical protein